MRSLIAAAAAFCVFYLVFGAGFFVLGGFVLWMAHKRMLFAVIVAIPSLLAGGFTAFVAASPIGFPGPVGDLTEIAGQSLDADNPIGGAGRHG